MSPRTGKLRDYSADGRIVYITALAAVLGAVSAVAAWLLLHCIWLGSNLFYAHQWRSVQLDQWTVPRHWWTPLMPVLGGLLVGLIARYLSPNVRGHGMPEAVETIVFKGGRVQPRVAVLKPVATAISIGSGGPFGAEGPIIMTGGAIGSVLGQLLPMSGSERTVLMVSGAAAGMAAVFNCPMAATLLAVEILLFEWKPRSLVPVAIACVTATSLRKMLLGPSPILNMVPTTHPVEHLAMLGALVLGICAAFVAAGLGRAVHFWERMFEKLPIHWMWWPAIGGVGIGLCGMVFPEALGVGFSNIQQMIDGNGDWNLLLGILFIKTLMWSFSLGSNTAGGILAPLLMIGGALGAVFGHVMPQMTPGAWVLMGMTAVLAASIGAPLTSAMLALEATHNGGLALPVLLACMASYAVSVLVQRRSMLTAGLSRKGLHLSRELGVDPLEAMLVTEAMHTSVFCLPNTATRKDASDWYQRLLERGPDGWTHWQTIFPLVDGDGRLTGLLTYSQMMDSARKEGRDVLLQQDANPAPVNLFPSQTLKVAASLMLESGMDAFPVVSSDGKLVGIITSPDLLKSRSQESQRERGRERILRPRWPFGDRRPAAADMLLETMGTLSEAERARDAESGAEAEDETEHEPSLTGHS